MSTQQQNQNPKVQIKRRKRRRPCFFCANKLEMFDYKQLDLFKRFTTDRGKIVPKRNSGACAKHQRIVAQAAKRARYMGLIPYCID